MREGSIPITEELERVAQTFAREDRHTMANLLRRAVARIEEVEEAAKLDRQRLRRITEARE